MPKKVFVIYDYAGNDQYVTMVNTLSENSDFEFEFAQQLTNIAIDSDEATAIQAKLAEKMNESKYILVVIDQQSHNSKWIKWQIEKAKQPDINLKFAAAKLDPANTIPAALPGNTAIAEKFTFSKVTLALTSLDYQYDIFISYKKDYKSQSSIVENTQRIRWLKEIFLPDFLFALEGKIARNPNIYIDESEISVGDKWEDRLKIGLATSRCLVAILSNPYFYDSEWCLREFCFMKCRWEDSKEKYPNTFIFPFLYQDTNLDHPLIKGLESADYIKYNKVGDAFKNSKEFLSFQNDIRKSADTIKNVVNNPPPADPKWVTDGWLKKVDEMVKEYRKLKLDTKIKSSDVQF